MGSAKALNSPVTELMEIAKVLRGEIVSYSNFAGMPHLGSCLSCVDILTCLYFNIMKVDPENPSDAGRDRFIISKGHGAPALFQVLAKRGFFPQSHMFRLDHGDGLFGEHPPAPKDLPGIEAATGSLGHGLPMGVGMALAGRINSQDYRVFALVSDGECNEGTIWEAALFAAAQKLGNLYVIIDYNKWQATARSDEVMAIAPLIDKWRAFGWDTEELDGHDMEALLERLSVPSNRTGKPIATIAHTIKGRGVSFMEDDNNWHYRIPTELEVRAAKTELGVA